ncbi:hypothetical protein D3C71_1692900 [compost metagenome]
MNEPVPQWRAPHHVFATGIDGHVEQDVVAFNNLPHEFGHRFDAIRNAMLMSNVAHRLVANDEALWRVHLH